METFRLIRFLTNDSGTFGVFCDEFQPLWMTLEDAWLNNKRNVSCIPAGAYICEKYVSKKFGATYIVKDVPDRDGILFHVGNYAGKLNEVDGDTHGCILLGRRFAGERLAESLKAFDEFKAFFYQTERFILEIVSLWELEDNQKGAG